MNSGTDIFNQINNALLDLQSADLQSYEYPLKKLGRLLRHDDLLELNSTLTQGIDLTEFIFAGEATQGSMIGSAHLTWPDDDRLCLGLKLLLVQKFGADPQYIYNFGHSFYNSGSNKIMSDINSVISQLIIPFIRDYKIFVFNQGRMETKLVYPHSKKIFIVHGHDVEARETVARFLSQIDFDPIILHEQASLGRTVIEKVEANSDVGFAVVLLTADDMGRAKNAADLEPRARQNVLLELGYFIAKLGRPRVCALKKGTVEIPSDFAGVVWEDMDELGAWKQKLGRELNGVGYNIDWNMIMK